MLQRITPLLLTRTEFRWLWIRRTLGMQAPSRGPTGCKQMTIFHDWLELTEIDISAY